MMNSSARVILLAGKNSLQAGRNWAAGEKVLVGSVFEI
jgi:hypothetical protein